MISNNFNIEALTSIQYQAVTFPLESLLVLAGPGTGKTRTLVHRIAYLISEYKISSEFILAVTYTNKATEEMRLRLRDMLPADAQRLNIGTFHSFCIRLLREYYDRVSLPKHFGVTDEKGQLSILQMIVPSLKEAKEVKKLLSKFNHCQLIGDSKLPISDFESNMMVKYKTELRRQSLIDFEDILLLAQKLLLENEDILEICKKKFRAVLVDEFQDTDMLQYRILKKLCLNADKTSHIPIFAVADDDQSIFAWRGANPENLKVFTQDFLPRDPSTHIIKLEENYRCSGSIVTEANRLIQASLVPRLFQKLPLSVNEEGNPIILHIYENDQLEAEGIALDILKTSTSVENISYRDMVVLYRRHQIGEKIETALLKQKIPCQIIRGKSLFDTPQIRQIVNLMKVQSNPDDEISLQDLLIDFLDEITILKILEYARWSKISIRAAIWKRLRVPEATFEERRRLNCLIGLLNLSKLLIEGNEVSSLSEWTTAIDLYLKQSNNENLNLSNISDPLKFEILTSAARWLERLNLKEGRLIVASSNPLFEHAAYVFLNQLTPFRKFSLLKLSETNFIEKDEHPNLLFVLDRNSEQQGVSKLKISAIIRINKGSENLRSDWVLPRLDLNTNILLEKECGVRNSIFCLIWKLGQAYQSLYIKEFLPNYTAIDIETTDLDSERNDFVEIAAIHVRNGKIENEFSTLIKPTVPISPNAQAVHNISSEMVANSPGFSQIAKKFREFLGNDVLVAHNGLGFDFPILKRQFKDLDIKFENLLFDTLPMARQMYPNAKRAKLESLAEKFSVDTGSNHRALDDTRTLVKVFEFLKADYITRERCLTGQDALGYLSIAMLLEYDETIANKSYLYQVGKTKWNAGNIEDFVTELLQIAGKSNLTETLSSVWQQPKAESLTEKNNLEGQTRFSEVIKQFDNIPIREALREFLDFIHLFQSQDNWKKRNAVSLITIHAAKGLEFSNVWIAGLEQGVLPSFQSVGAEPLKRNAKIDEERRLLYVAMTRAQKSLTLSYATERNGFTSQPSEFLNDFNTSS